MQHSIRTLTLAGVASLAGLGGTAALSSDAEAHGRRHFHRPGFTIILKDRHSFDYGLYRYSGGGCGWLFHRWQHTGSLKWYRRWHLCKYGW